MYRPEACRRASALQPDASSFWLRLRHLLPQVSLRQPTAESTEAIGEPGGQLQCVYMRLAWLVLAWGCVLVLIATRRWRRERRERDVRFAKELNGKLRSSLLMP